MRVVIVVNPRSGRGRAAILARALGPALAADDHDVTLTEPESLSRALAPAGALPPDAAIIVGGDGTVHHALPDLRRSGVPFWHAPTGTENLIARELAHSADIAPIRAALRAGRSRPLDLIEISPSAGGPGSLAAIMFSVGPDAGVIARLDASRTGPITHASYIRPSLAEALAPSLAPLSVWADGREIVRHRPGWLVVANMRQFGVRIDPCPEANPADGLLDVAFFPASTTLGVLFATLRCRLRLPAGVRTRAHTLIVSRGACPAQADGEVFSAPITLARLRAVGGLRAIVPA